MIEIVKSYFSFAEETKKFLEDTNKLIQKNGGILELHEALEQLYVKKKNAEIWLYGIVYVTSSSASNMKLESYRLYFLNKLNVQHDDATLRRSIEVAKSAKAEWLVESEVSDYFKFYQQIETCEYKLKEALGLNN